MKVVLFCGGLGLRLRDYSENIPKPMVPIGNRPIIWHLMKYYAHYGHRDFILCLGYKGDAFKEYFLNYKEWVSNDFVLTNGGKSIRLLNTDTDDWSISFVHTGFDTNIGQRLMAVREHLDGEEMFMANYADNLTDMPLDRMVAYARERDKVACFMSTRPTHTFHCVDLHEDGHVRQLTPVTESDIWINGGFFVFKRTLFDYMQEGEELVLNPFERLVEAGELMSYRYDGFWACMDTFKERQLLNDMCRHERAPWQVWEKAGASPNGQT